MEFSNRKDTLKIWAVTHNQNNAGILPDLCLGPNPLGQISEHRPPLYFVV